MIKVIDNSNDSVYINADYITNVQVKSGTIEIYTTTTLKIIIGVTSGFENTVYDIIADMISNNNGNITTSIKTRTLEKYTPEQMKMAEISYKSDGRYEEWEEVKDITAVYSYDIKSVTFSGGADDGGTIS